MKRRAIAAMAATLFAVTLLFTACGKKREFEIDESQSRPDEIVTETTTEEEFTFNEADGKEFDFAIGIKMGMTNKQVQKLIGINIPTKLVDGRKNIMVEFSGAFINFVANKKVQFMFDQKTEKLEQIQFQCNTETDGAMTADAIMLFNKRYGRGALHHSRYENHIWYYGGTYIILSVVDDNNYVITYTEKEYFKQNMKDDYAAFIDAVKEAESEKATKQAK